MHFLYLNLNFRKAGPQCHLQPLDSPFRRSKSSHQSSTPVPPGALPFLQQRDSAAPNATHAQPGKQDGRQCDGLPASVRGLRPDRPLSDNAQLVLDPNISRRSSPNPYQATAPECATLAPASRSLAGLPSARAHPKMADDPSTNRTK